MRKAYGQVGRLRRWLESRGVAHVLAVPTSQMVVSMDLRAWYRRTHSEDANRRQLDRHRLELARARILATNVGTVERGFARLDNGAIKECPPPTSAAHSPMCSSFTSVSAISGQA